MKTLKIFALCAFAAVALTACSDRVTKEKTPKGITNSEIDQVSYMIGQQFGEYMKGNNFGALSFSQIKKGIKDAMNGVALDEETFYSVMNEYMEKRMNALKEENEAKAAKFFEENGKKDGVVTTESGIQYKIVREGNGVKPVEGSTVKVCYEGKLLDGTVFDSSYERNDTVTFALNQVIKGWGEGLTYCEEGGEILLWIPAELGYGERGAGGLIGPGSALNFRVELISTENPELSSEPEEN
ncbi:MAG: FKBP-type peptidyl-prolyl cis-trans isomerase [Bacteroidales bacterium]|nr:FKBP-type peptidyl-prolyl cis-trans isomerase [Bacteroidales bacterium]